MGTGSGYPNRILEKMPSLLGACPGFLDIHSEPESSEQVKGTMKLPSLITFDVFGTIIDWRTGLQADLAKAGCPCSDELFDRIIAAQAGFESGPFRSYREITAASLIQIAGLDPTVADQIGQRVGHWPFFPDARAKRLCSALRRACPLHRHDQ